MPGSFQGSTRRVSLPSYQQSLLNGMDSALEARDPRLASMFALFTRLTRDDGPPRTERLVIGPALWRRLLLVPARAAKTSATIPIALVAGLMAAIIALGIVTSRGSSCPSGTHHVQQIRTALCEPSAQPAHR